MQRKRTKLRPDPDSGFSWQADGSLISANDSTGGGAYSYNTTGLLTNRTVGNRSTSVTSRDGEGRPLSIITSVNMVPELKETNVWSGDGLLASHTLWRGDYLGMQMDNRAYAYANASRRLTQEQLNVNASTIWTNTFAYDNGLGSGPGVLTSAGQSGASTPQWSGSAGSFSRVSASTNTMISYSAYGHSIGLVTLNALLDNQPVPVTTIESSSNAMEWRAPLQLTPGTHQLLVAAQAQNGLYMAWATNTFTNTASYQASTDTYDAAGNITNRVWRNPTTGVDRTQNLSWDARGRLHAVTERDAGNSGYNWTASYDGLNRRISTTSVLVTNGVAFNSSPTTINSYYDPQVEFLELGVNYGINTEFKLYGPDLNGVYGGMNGVGGLDAISPFFSLFEPTISDERGNILAVETNSAVVWNPARPTGYGAIPGYLPLPLANGADISSASAWRGRWADITGFYNVGLRPYDPVSGRWLTFDSVWNEIDPSGMTFCGGDPINGFDSDGKCLEGLLAARNQEGYMPGNASSAWMAGNYFGSIVSGFSQGGSQGIDNIVNFAETTLFYRSDAGGSPQDFIQSFPLASPMQNVFGVNYGDNTSGNNFAGTFGPLTQNAINSYGVGQTTAEVPTAEVPPPDYNAPQTGFYVTPDGTAVPATGYRAIGGSAVTEALNMGIIESRNPTYFSFDNTTTMSPNAVEDWLQLPRTPSYVATFNTLQVMDTIFTPTVGWNTGTTPEPYANSNPQWGTGGGSQAATTSFIQGFNLTPLTGTVNAPPSTTTTIVPFHQP